MYYTRHGGGHVRNRVLKSWHLLPTPGRVTGSMSLSVAASSRFEVCPRLGYRIALRRFVVRGFVCPWFRVFACLHLVLAGRYLLRSRMFCVVMFSLRSAFEVVRRVSDCFIRDLCLCYAFVMAFLDILRSFLGYSVLCTLKALIFAGTNFRENLFLLEFIFAILTKIAKFTKICSHKISRKSKICEISSLKNLFPQK